MTNGLNDIIKKLEQQRTAIERALAALRIVDGSEAASSDTEAPARATRKATRKGGMTPDGRRRLSEALRKRWAAKKAGSGPAPNAKASAAKAPAKRKGGMTPEGRKRLSEALRKRWAAKRAGQAGQTKRAKRTAKQ